MRATDYLATIEALIITHAIISQLSITREEAQDEIGIIRSRLILIDGSLLELFERFKTSESQVQVTKYSYHWQDAAGNLRKRWDNAAHYPTLQTFPHHVHIGPDDEVLPHEQITIQEVLDQIEAEIGAILNQ